MNYRALGSTGLQVSEVGFGAWGIGGASKGAISYGRTDDQESRKALMRAFEQGVTFYDTADLYGYGHSESLLGDALKPVRQRVVIASKVGLLNQDGGQDFSPKHMKQSLEGSLKRLQTDYLDLYQLHDPPIQLLEEDDSICETLRSLKKEGKIRAWGISLRSPEDGLIAIKKFRCEVVQANFNMVDQRLLQNGLMHLCRTERAGLVSRTPLCFGFLTGVYSAETKFDAQDHRSRWPASQIEVWANASKLFSSLQQREAQSNAQIALRYCLSYPEVSTVIPGMLHVWQVDENVEASRLGPLKNHDREEIEAIYKRHTFFLVKSGGRAMGSAHRTSNDPCAERANTEGTCSGSLP